VYTYLREISESVSENSANPASEHRENRAQGTEELVPSAFGAVGQFAQAPFAQVMLRSTEGGLV